MKNLTRIFVIVFVLGSLSPGHAGESAQQEVCVVSAEQSAKDCEPEVVQEDPRQEDAKEDEKDENPEQNDVDEKNEKDSGSSVGVGDV